MNRRLIRITAPLLGIAALERQMAATDAEIDRQMYALYGLTEEEVKVVEGAAK